MTSALDTIEQAARSALVWASQPQGAVVLAGGVAALALAIGVVGLARGRRPRPIETSTQKEEDAVAESRILILKLIGDADHAAGVRLAAVLSRRFDGVAGVAHAGASPMKPGSDLDDQARQARAAAQRARVGLAIWGVVEGSALRLRLLEARPGAAPEMLALPSDLRPPFDLAAVAHVAAVGAETPALAGLRQPLAHAVGEISDSLATDPPEDPHDAARLSAALARAALTLDRLEPDRGRLKTALTATASPDGRRTLEPIEWAEARARRDQALQRSHAGLAEPPLAELQERVEACRGVLRVWTNAHVPGRVARAEAALLQALLDLADHEGDMSVVEEAERIAESALARSQAGRGGLEDASWLIQMTGFLGGARLRLGEREPKTSRLEAAELDLRRALTLAEASGDAPRAAIFRDDLARALARLGERDRDSKRLRAAAGIYRGGLAVEGRDELARARARAALGRTLVHVAERDRDAAVVDEAVATLRAASKGLADAGAAVAATQARRVLERAERLYAELRTAQSGARARAEG
jgi:hypothetical protein